MELGVGDVFAEEAEPAVTQEEVHPVHLRTLDPAWFEAAPAPADEHSEHERTLLSLQMHFARGDDLPGTLAVCERLLGQLPGRHALRVEVLDTAVRCALAIGASEAALAYCNQALSTPRGAVPTMWRLWARCQHELGRPLRRAFGLGVSLSKGAGALDVRSWLALAEAYGELAAAGGDDAAMWRGAACVVLRRAARLADLEVTVACSRGSPDWVMERARAQVAECSARGIPSHAEALAALPAATRGSGDGAQLLSGVPMRLEVLTALRDEQCLAWDYNFRVCVLPALAGEEVESEEEEGDVMSL